MKELEIIYEDKDVLVIRKEAGVPVQSARGGGKGLREPAEKLLI